MTEEQIEMLKKAGFPENIWDSCYIKDDLIYPPLVENGIIIKSGEERYKEKFEKAVEEIVEEKPSFLGKIKRLFGGGA